MGKSEGGEQSESQWFLVGNIRSEPLDESTRAGTKHFSAGTKLYCLPAQWGDGYEDIIVVGRHRGSKKYVAMTINRKHIENWRAQVVYSPAVLNRARTANQIQSKFHWHWEEESAKKSAASLQRSQMRPGSNERTDMDELQLTQACIEYLATGMSVRTMTNEELREQLRSAQIDPGKFNRVLSLNSALGGLQLPDKKRTDRTIFQTIGIPADFQLDPHSDSSVPFFDLGVAAPCSVEILRNGAVVADFRTDIPPVQVADSFEVFIEGLSRESLAWERFGKSTESAFPGDIATAREQLTDTGRVPEASDQWTVWWETDQYSARLSTVWDYIRSVDLVVWHDGPVPKVFAEALAGSTSHSHRARFKSRRVRNWLSERRHR